MAARMAEKTAAPPTHRAAQAISTRSSIIHFYEWRVRSRLSPSIFHGLLLHNVGAAPRIPPIPLFFSEFRGSFGSPRCHFRTRSAVPSTSEGSYEIPGFARIRGVHRRGVGDV